MFRYFFWSRSRTGGSEGGKSRRGMKRRRKKERNPINQKTSKFVCVVNGRCSGGEAKIFRKKRGRRIQGMEKESEGGKERERERQKEMDE
jgi:hypothetical protein